MPSIQDIFNSANTGTTESDKNSVAFSDNKNSSIQDIFNNGTQQSSSSAIKVNPTVKEQVVEGLKYGGKTGAATIGEGINEYNKWFYNIFNKGKGAFGETYEPSYEKNQQKIKEYEEKTQNKLIERLGEEGANSFITQASGAIAQGAGQLAAFALSPIIGFSTLGAQTIGSGKQAYTEAYTQSLAQGKSEEEARKIGNINGIITGAVNSLEALPIFRVLGIGKDILKKPLSMAFKNVAGRVAKTGLTEAGTEGLQQLGQDLTAKATYNKDETPLKNAIMATLISIPTGILFGGAGEINLKLRLKAIDSAKKEITSQLEDVGIPNKEAVQTSEYIVNQYAVMGDENVFEESTSITRSPEQIVSDAREKVLNPQKSKAQIIVEQAKAKITPETTQIQNKEIEAELPINISTPESREEASLKPVGEGKKKKSTLYQRMIDRLNEDDKVKLEGKEPIYNEGNRNIEREKAVSFVLQNSDIAKEIIFGTQSVPEGMLKNDIATALAEKSLSEGKIDQWHDIAFRQSLQSTRYGQEIGALRGVASPDNPTYWLTQIISNQMMAGEKQGLFNVLYEKATKGKSAKTKASEKIKNNVKIMKGKLEQQKIKVKEAEELLNSLLC